MCRGLTQTHCVALLGFYSHQQSRHSQVSGTQLPLEIPPLPSQLAPTGFSPKQPNLEQPWALLTVLRPQTSFHYYTEKHLAVQIFTELLGVSIQHFNSQPSTMSSISSLPVKYIISIFSGKAYFNLTSFSDREIKSQTV